VSLRSRLALVLSLVAVPLVAAMTWARGVLDYRAEVEALHGFIEGRMEDGRGPCEADPARFPPPRHGGPRGARFAPGRPADGLRDGPPPDGRRPPPRNEPDGPPIDLFAYGEDFVSANPRAPSFPAGLRQALEAGADRADEEFLEDGRSGLRVAARMGWGESPCSIVMAIRPGVGPHWLTRNQVITAGALAFALTLAVFLAAGPIVRRVRTLQGEVRRSAREGYSTPVTVTGSDEIAQLAQEFNDAAEEVRRQFRAVEDREQALRSFVANTTHDVMIPMTVLQGHLSALRDAEGHPDPEVLRDAMEEVHYMTSLIQNLSASAKLEAGEPAVEFGAVDLNALVERVVARHAPIARQKGIELNFASPEEAIAARGDVTLLEQAVSNLVHNAVRYGESGGHVALLLESRKNGTWSLRVLDDGPGITDELIERLMQRSIRGDEARSRHPEGQGLGLHIALEVARRHGFTLELRRSEYGGLEAELRG